MKKYFVRGSVVNSRRNMLLDWVNIKYVGDNGRMVMVRGNKSTLSNKVIFYMECGFPFKKALKEAKSERAENLVLAPIKFVL